MEAIAGKTVLKFESDFSRKLLLFSLMHILKHDHDEFQVVQFPFSLDSMHSLQY